MVFVNGNESVDWRDERELLTACQRLGYAVAVVDPRGVGRLRPEMAVKGHDYADPLCGVEENIAYNAFLTGGSLASMRVADVLTAVQQIKQQAQVKRLVLCGRRDAALIACLAAALEPAITHVAAEEMLLSLRMLFAEEGRPINAASIVPGLLARFGDIAEILAQIAPRPILLAAGTGKNIPDKSITAVEDRFSTSAQVLTDWLAK